MTNHSDASGNDFQMQIKAFFWRPHHHMQKQLRIYSTWLSFVCSLTVVKPALCYSVTDHKHATCFFFVIFFSSLLKISLGLFSDPLEMTDDWSYPALHTPIWNSFSHTALLEGLYLLIGTSTGNVAGACETKTLFCSLTISTTVAAIICTLTLLLIIEHALPKPFQIMVILTLLCIYSHKRKGWTLGISFVSVDIGLRFGLE